MTQDPNDVEELRKEVKEVKQENRKIKETLAKMMPGRRDLLKGLGGAAIGGAAMFGATGSASAGTASAGQIGTQSKPQDAYLEDVYDQNGNRPMSYPGDGSVSVVDLSITDRTYISARPSADISLSANTWTDLTLGNELKDRRGELDPSTGTISPSTTGHYEIRGGVFFDGTSSGDSLEVRLQNITDSTARFSRLGALQNPDGGGNKVFIYGSGQLDSAKDYKVQVRNVNSNDNISFPETDVVVDWVEEAQ